jgi:outer membrane protein OmpA-like peptidoglycan-associated protein
MKRIITLALLASAVVASRCAREAGYHRTGLAYGDATQINFNSQDAYNASSERLRSLSADFRQNTTDTVTFAFDRSGLDSTARAALNTQAAWLKANKSVKMTIIGHADLVGSERYNQGLGLRRARAVLRYLNRQGISKKRLEAIASRGESEPVVPTDQRERRNRRAQTTVSGFSRNYVGTGLDGEVAARVYDVYQSGNFGVTEAESGDIN